MRELAQSKHADKFVARMPDGMRGRLQKYASKHLISMNAAAIQAIESFLDKHEELNTILAGVRLCKAALERERSEVANLRAELEARLAALGQPDAEQAKSEK